MMSGMEFTGERVVAGNNRDGLQQGLFTIHQALYRFVAQSCRNKRVLDVGCGTGHGLHVLSRGGATAVLGVDRARDAAAVAASLSGPEIPHKATPQVMVSDASILATLPHIFDVVCAIEVIEHLASVPAFLDEMQRVMKPDGVCFFSTPNRLTHSPGRIKPINPFHLVEYTYEELAAVLSRAFTQVQLFTVHIQQRSFIVRYQPAAIRHHLPFPLAHMERFVVWHIPPWNRRMLQPGDVTIISTCSSVRNSPPPDPDPQCWGFLARCTGPKQCL